MFYFMWNTLATSSFLRKGTMLSCVLNAQTKPFRRNAGIQNSCEKTLIQKGPTLWAWEWDSLKKRRGNGHKRERERKYKMSSGHHEVCRPLTGLISPAPSSDQNAEATTLVPPHTSNVRSASTRLPFPTDVRVPASPRLTHRKLSAAKKSKKRNVYSPPQLFPSR